MEIVAHPVFFKDNRPPALEVQFWNRLMAFSEDNTALVRLYTDTVVAGE